jgi:hypothetical protein
VLRFGSAYFTLSGTRHSRLVVDVPASETGSSIGGGLELRGLGRCDDASVVPGVESDGRIEPYGSCRHLLTVFLYGPVSEIFCRKLAASQVDNPKMLEPRGGKDTRVPCVSCVLQSLDVTCESGASSPCACSNPSFFKLLISA